MPEIFGVIIELLTQTDDVVLDPFAGVGGVLEAAASQGRRSVGIELSAAQYRRGVQRLRQIPGFVFNQNADTSFATREVGLNG